MIERSWTDYSHYFENNLIIAAFTNRFFPYSKPHDRVEFAKSLELDYKNIVEPIQKHSNNIVIYDNSRIIENTDGVLTNKQDLVLSIQVADCIPIFLFDKRNLNFGLVHAGWRGVQLGIVESGIEKMLELNSIVKDIQILLGPSIKQCCFEVGPEVGDLFDKKYQIKGIYDRMLLDLQRVVKGKLSDLGIGAGNIVDIEECTHCSEDYHSHRRDGKKAGRMIAMMGWK